MYKILSLWKRLFLLFLFSEKSVCADLDQQFHGWSVDAIDNDDGCVVFQEELEQLFIRHCASGVTIHPSIWPKGEECGVMVAVCVDDGAGLEVK